MGTLYVPGIGKVNFPSSMSHTEMENIVKKNWPEMQFATYGELGDIKLPGGEVSKETSITVNDPRINQGQWTNIPTQVKGQIDVYNLARTHQPTPEQQEIAILRAMERVKQGQLLPSYGTAEEAGIAASARTKALMPVSGAIKP